MFYEYYISPKKKAIFSINRDLSFLKKIELVSANNIFFVKILFAELGLPNKLTIDKWRSIFYKNTIQLKTTFKKIDNSHYFNEEMKTVISGRKIEMNIPYFHYYLLGNDLSYYSLIYEKTITLRCSSFIYKDELYCFLGNSGAGKTSILSSVKNRQNVTIMSDDHLMIKMDKGIISVLTPLWDQINLDGSGKNKTVKNLNIFFLNNEINTKIISINEPMKDILKYTVLFSFSKDTINSILELQPKILKKSRSFLVPVRNWSLLHKFIFNEE